MSVTSTKNAIISKLQAMQTLKNVYAWETSNPGGDYPLATVTINEGSGEVTSSSHNLRRRGYRINIYQEQSKIGQGPERAEIISMAVIDELEQAMDLDTTFSGAVKYCDPIGWTASYIDREIDTRILEITLNAYEIVYNR